ncbi:hypothetical protein [Demequina oxidasica]|uniref:hypothetical protein n=1 Tax=Demequina oxidasica TaxID=676199 RepID=UPI00128CDB51|nr:hypothetical protein [Demequina oxidasica]
MTTPVESEGAAEAVPPKRRRPLWVWLLVGIGLALVFVPVGKIVSCSDSAAGEGSCTTSYVSVVGMITGIGYSGS